MGNFSRDTFNKLKHYISVRMQQGVPLLDADWNEQEDIRKHELRTFLKWFVGNGVPKGNDGFRIIPHAGGAENDFTIKGGMENEPGYCLVDGWDAMIEQDIDYTKQPLFNNETLAQAWGVEPLSPLSPPSSGERTDTVYLDVWEREVDAQEDSNLVNPSIGIETCVRLKREWVVRVVQGVTTPPAPAPGHVYYPLASLKRLANQNAIGPGGITDLRRTGLAVLSEAITIKDGNVGIGETNPIDRLVVGGAIDPVIRMTSTDGSTGFIQTLQENGGVRLYDGKDYTMHWKNGNVGIGTTSPQKQVHIQGASSAPFIYDANDRPGLAITGHYPELDLFSSANNGNHGPTIRMGGYNDDSNTSSKHWSIGTSGRNSRFLDFGFQSGDNPNPHLGIRGLGKTVMTLLENGNVGIGTLEPQKQVHIQGVSSAPFIYDSNDRPGLAITGHYPELDLFSSANNGNHGPTIRMGGYNDDSSTSSKHWSIGTSGRNSRFLDFGCQSGTDPNPHAGIRGYGKTVLTLMENGHVGIGTLEPQKNVHIQGASSAPFINDGNDRPGLAITGNYPELDLFSGVNNVNHGPTIRMGGYNDDSKTSSKHWSIGTSGRNSCFLDIGIGPNSDPNPHAGIRNHNGRTVMTLIENGNVGIGTTNPQCKLDVNGVMALHGDRGNQLSIQTSSRRWDLDVDVGYADSLRFRDMTSGATHMYIKTSGLVCGQFGPWGSDYSEYFESKDGKEIEAGTSIILDKGKIRPAKKNEAPMGIISANPGIVGGVHIEWPKKYLRDEFGRHVMEEYQEEIMVPKKEKVKKERQKVEKKKVKEKVTKTEIAFEDGKYFQKEITETVTREVEEPVFKEVDLYDAEKKKIIGKHRIPVMETYEEEIDVLDDNGQPVMKGSGKYETKTRAKLNPDYDEKREYIPREKRPEWNCVGLLGQLPLRKGQPTAPTWVKIKDISKDVELWLVK